jgi:sugar lactone lactonase YvrE
MFRLILASATLTFAATQLAAQDMPLSQILIDGEHWQKAPDTGWNLTPQQVKFPGIEQPTCKVLSPDNGTLFVASAIGRYVWAFRVENDGSLTAGQPYCSLRVSREQKDVPVAAMTLDSVGRVYAATPLGIQVFDPTGRLCGVIDNPPEGAVIAMGFSPTETDRLYVATRKMPYSRKLKARGVAQATREQ